MNHLFISFVISQFVLVINCFGQEDSIYSSFYEVNYDTSKVDVFKGAENASVKIDYYHSDGYSYVDRYWYEVVLIDSLLILKFQSPDNDDWDYIKYQKQYVIGDNLLAHLLSTIDSSKIKQKKKGIPLPPASGYTSDRLYIETDSLAIEGGTVYINLGEDVSQEKYNSRINYEMDISTSISGDYRMVFLEIEKLFVNLPNLLRDMQKK